MGIWALQGFTLNDEYIIFTQWWGNEIESYIYLLNRNTNKIDQTRYYGQINDLTYDKNNKYVYFFNNCSNSCENARKIMRYVGTGDRIQIYLGNELIAEYKVCIKGDIDGNGVISPLDYVKNKIIL